MAIESLSTWADLEEHCPISIQRIGYYYSKFRSRSSMPVSNVIFLEYAKESLIEARGSLDMMLTTLMQNLYDNEMYQERTDIVLFQWLQGDIKDLINFVNDREQSLIITKDYTTGSLIGITHVASYIKIMNNIASAVFESLVKATREYNNVPEEGFGEIKKDKRMFLYILFQVIRVSFSVLSGYTKESAESIKKRNILNSMNAPYTSMMTKTGQTKIEDAYTKQTGQELPEITTIESMFKEEFNEDESE